MTVVAAAVDATAESHFFFGKAVRAGRVGRGWPAAEEMSEGEATAPLSPAGLELGLRSEETFPLRIHSFHPSISPVT
jgi:hypothetical protein